jgi:hypothetical protein
MGFNRRRMEAERKAKADAEVAARRAAGAQVVADAETTREADGRLWMRRLEFDPVAFVIVCGVYAVVVVLHWHHTYPIDDEIAFVPATINDAWTGWVTPGFSEYFQSYGSWSEPSGQYIKPIDNLTYWLVHQVSSRMLFHDRFLVYMLLYCAAVFFGARLLYHCAVGLGSRTMQQASIPSADQGGGKRCQSSYPDDPTKGKPHLFAINPSSTA